MVKSIGDAVVAVDLAGNVTFLNPAAEFILGKKLDEVVGRPAREVVQLLPAEGPEGRSPLERALIERQPIQPSEGRLLSEDSSMRIVSDSASPVVDRDQLLGAVMVFHDVTEQKRTQSQLELSDRLASLARMAAGVAHEINSPLAVVAANTELLLEELRDARREPPGATSTARAAMTGIEHVMELLTEIEVAGERIARIVRDLTAFARPAPRADGEADVRRAIARAVRSTSHELEHRARVVTDVADVPPVRLDEDRLSQVLVHLLVNAAHAIPSGNASSNEVSVHARIGERDRVVIEVGHGLGNVTERPEASLRTVLHDEVRGHGNGNRLIDRPRDGARGRW